MIIFAGSRRNGLLAILTALLLPALGVGVASADMSVGDTVILKVPDLSEFAGDIEEHQFTCRAVTEHAYWLVQDTVSVKDTTGLAPLGTIVWDSLMTQAELDIMTADFEGGEVDVYGTVTEYLGNIPDTDEDPRIWIVFATIPDVYNSAPADRQVMVYVNPEDVDGSGLFNSHDIFYINVHSYTETEQMFNNIAMFARKNNVPNGLGELLRTAVLPTEDLWITRGLGAVCEYLCYGLTITDDGKGPGLRYDLKKLKRTLYIELTYWMTGPKDNRHLKDYCIARGAEFLWMMYLSQRYDDTILNSIAQSDTTSMLNVARAIDSSIPDSVAIQTNVVPIYDDWLICNLLNDLKIESFGGIYTYDILPDSIDFGGIGQSASFVKRFSSGYPLGVWIAAADKGMKAPIWAAQYVEFTGEYADYPTVYFNGMYSDGGGSGTVLDGKWKGLVVALNEDETEILSIETVPMDDFYMGSFELSGGSTYLITTNNNEGGLSDLRFVLSQDSDIPDVLLSAHQNTVNDQYITLYTTLYDSIPEGFDWYGPIFTATETTTDTSSLFTMSVFYETLWSHRFTAWEPGAYNLQIAGYDSTGFSATNSIAVSVDYVTSGGLSLSMNDIHLNVAAGAAAPGTMVSLCESGMLGLAVETQTSLEAVRGQLTGILAGPVSIPSIDAVISFPADNSEGAVYSYSSDGWNRLESWFQNGRMIAAVSDGGNYAFGSSPGVSSPEIPADFRFGGTYPNPFSAEAAISFSLPSTGHVNVTIYDMTGRAIRTLSDTEMMAAEHSLIWDGLDEAGHAVGAGVYFCRLQACGETVTQKMLRIE